MDNKKLTLINRDFGYYESDGPKDTNSNYCEPDFYSMEMIVEKFKSYNNEALLPQDKRGRALWDIGFRDEEQEKKRSDEVEARVKEFIDTIRQAAIVATQKLPFIVRGQDVLADLTKPYDCDAVQYTAKQHEDNFQKGIINEASVYIDIQYFAQWLVNESKIKRAWIPAKWVNIVKTKYIIKANNPDNQTKAQDQDGVKEKAKQRRFGKPSIIAEKLGIKKSTLYSAIKNGSILPYPKTGQNIDIERYVFQIKQTQWYISIKARNAGHVKPKTERRDPHSIQELSNRPDDHGNGEYKLN